MLARTEDRRGGAGTARFSAVVLAVSALALLTEAMVTGARLEQVLVGLGLAAAAAAAGLLGSAGGTGVSVVRHPDDVAR